MSILLKSFLGLAENAFMPDRVIRYGIRYLCRQRLKKSVSGQSDDSKFVEQMNNSPIAMVPELANEQHYEVPPEFFKLSLGPHLKYSGCLWDESTKTLGEAESASLEQVCQRAAIEDGHRILELGCGWGSLSLFLAQKFPNSHITSVSNSADQRGFIEEKIQRLNLTNLQIITADMNEFQTDRKFDRVVSIEMFEHMRNWGQLLSRIANWMDDQGRMFMHVFSNRSATYEFLSEGTDNWMGRHFFSGGIMPAHDLIRNFDQSLEVEEDWVVNGTHYQKTAEAWLANMDEHCEKVLEVFEKTYGSRQAETWFQRWRMFFMACAELFGYQDGQQWQVSHYRLKKTAGN
ncbi:MAG: cyclopropane-fatty-acyl-phospholipid synthase family protein [Planctomycetota bacterium]|nr:cyclopropane-fatty-acyl-phospholipid synthase family protein [Planctomycetota bacterium]